VLREWSYECFLYQEVRQIATVARGTFPVAVDNGVAVDEWFAVPEPKGY
jgi:hypothetical protein